jgi:hypothetical protein
MNKHRIIPQTVLPTAASAPAAALLPDLPDQQHW